MMLKRIRDLFSRRGGDSSSATAAENVVERGAVPVHRGPRVVHNPIPHSDLDPDAVKIVERLSRFDHSAYLVGGCVRDLLLERRPKDFDIGTSATPRQVKRLFRNSRIIGRRFRLAHIYFQGGKIIEVATFRSQTSADADNPDGDLLIRDDNRFGSAEEDALRRDFTINALFYDLNSETVLDHAEGLADLRRKLVRTIGDPLVRFQEDPIRILRAIKFAARLGFTIERGTLEALQAARGEIPKAASPRVLEEINRFCRGGAGRRSFELLRESGVFDVILPELAAAYAANGAAEENWSLLLAMLDEIDLRHGREIEAESGEVLTSLLLPAIRQRLGIGSDGIVEPPTGLDVRDLIDDVMRPIAQRLRFPRRDLERCRLTVMTLLRMVAMVKSSRTRRGSKAAILRRSCLPDALWMLGVLARHWGGDLETARTSWERAAASAEPAVDRPAPRRRAARGGRADGGRAQAPKRNESAGAESTRRPRGRRGGRGRETPAGAEAPRAAPKSADFFANLPTVPETERDEVSGDRYGSGTIASSGAAAPRSAKPDEPDRPRAASVQPADAAGQDEAEGESAEARTPRPRRRRSRRRGGARRTAARESDSAGTTSEAESGVAEPERDSEGSAAETRSADAAAPQEQNGEARPRRRRRRPRRRRARPASADEASPAAESGPDRDET